MKHNLVNWTLVIALLLGMIPQTAGARTPAPLEQATDPPEAGAPDTNPSDIFLPLIAQAASSLQAAGQDDHTGKAYFPLVAHSAAGAPQPTATPQPQPSPTPTDDGSVPTPTEEPTPTPAPFEALGVVDANGGQVSSPDGRVVLDVPAGAVTAATEFSLRWDHLRHIEPDAVGHFFVLNLQAKDVNSAASVDQFNADLLMTLNLWEFVPGKETYYLRRQHEQSGEWYAVIAGPVSTDDASAAQVPIDRPGRYGATSSDPNKEGWKLLFNDARVGLFNGSASYSYPIEVPPGPHGMQPGLTLSYNSGRANGVTSWIQSDWVGLGWNLDVAEIVRGVSVGDPGGQVHSETYGRHCNDLNVVCFNDSFNLLFNGTSYQLVPEGNGRYHTEDESFLRIERVSCYNNNNSPAPIQCPGTTNQGGYDHTGLGGRHVFDYWTVTTQDGTVYRLGTHVDSEQRYDQACVRFHDQGGYTCAAPERVVYRWRLDQVQDVYGNRMEYRYAETSAEGQDYRRDGGNVWPGRNAWDRESYLASIHYAWVGGQSGFWGYEVHFVRSCRGGARCGTQTPDGINDAPRDNYGENAATLWFQRQVLTAIEVRQMTAPSAVRLIRKYSFEYGESGDRSGLYNGEGLPSRVLTGITVAGLNGAGSLPPTTFVYEPLGNVSTDSNCADYQYGRLRQIDNGYGGVITLNYHKLEEGGACGPNQRHHNWWVASKIVTDNLTPPQRTAYQYAQPCYRQAGSATVCHGVNHPEDAVHSLTGFGLVTETVSSADPYTVLAATAHRFYPDDADWNLPSQDLGERLSSLVGREKSTRQLNETGIVLRETRTVYGTNVLIEKTGFYTAGQPIPDATFIHADEVIQSEYSADGTTLLAQTRTATAYDTNNGKPIAQYNYGDTRTITNGSFEEGMKLQDPPGVQVPVDWLLLHNGGEPTTVAISTTATAALIGGMGLQLRHVSGVCNECGVYRQISGLQPNTPYSVSVRVRRVAGAATFKLWLHDGAAPHLYREYPVGSTDWVMLSQQITSRSGSIVIHLVMTNLSGPDAGAFYVDDIWYEPVSSTGDEKSAATWYIGNPANNVVVPIVQRSFGGVDFVHDASNRWEDRDLAMTRFTYDDKSVNGNGYDQVTIGELTAQHIYHDTIRPDWLQHGYYTTRFGYDDQWGNQTSVTDPLNRVTTTEYDPTYHTYPIRVTNDLGQASQMAYDYGFGKVKRVIDPNSVETRLEYDSFGRLTHVIEDGDSAEQPTTRYIYNDDYTSSGKRLLRIETWLREQDDNLRPIYEFYSGRGLLIQTRSELTELVTQSVAVVDYDALGRTIRNYVTSSDSYSDTYRLPANLNLLPRTTTSYDMLGRTVQVDTLYGATLRTYYNGYETAVVDANNHQKISVVDAYGQLVTVKEYTGDPESVNFNTPTYATTRYQYDLLGRLLQVTDALGQLTTMTYDTLGRKTAMHDPNMGAWSYTYDALGNMTSQTDAKGAKTCFYYDRLNRLLGKLYNVPDSCPASPGAYHENYVYDEASHGIGRRTSMGNADVTVAWTYDPRGRMTAETRTLTGGGAYTFRYTYDSANRVVTTEYPTSEVVSHGYTAAWQPKTLASSLLPTYYVADAGYNARGQLQNLSTGNGLNTHYTYYGDDLPSLPGSLSFTRLQKQEVGAALLRLEYVYDRGGNITRLTDASNSGQEQVFAYDELDRLTSARTSTSNPVGDGKYDQSYSYDKLGSFRSMAGRTYVYDTHHPQAVRYAYILGPTVGPTGRFDAFTENTAGWTLCGACARESYEGEQVLRNGPAGQSASDVRRDDFNLLSGNSDVVQVEFKVTGDTDTVLQLENLDGTGAVVHAFGILATPKEPNLRVRRMVNGNDEFVEFNPGFAFALNTWYVVRIYTSGTGPQETDTFRIYVWQRDDPATRAYYETSGVAWVGLTWRFHNWANTQPVGDLRAKVYLDSYFELKGAGAGVFSYRYDANGNMIARTEMGVGYSQAWDANNRLTRVRYGSTNSTPEEYSFTYDPDGNRVLQIAANGDKTAYAGGGLYEITRIVASGAEEQLSYYVFGGQRVAMRQGIGASSTVTWLHGDHLGSTSLATASGGVVVAQSRAYYLPFGDSRGAAATGLPTDFTFTGQRLTADIGLIQMGARWYDAKLGRWTSADTIVPELQNSQAFDRYQYVENNPLRYNDPSGHCLPCPFIPLAALAIWMTRLPGDTPRNDLPSNPFGSDPRDILLLSALEPFDYLMTASECFQGRCDAVDFTLMLTPGLNSQADDVAAAMLANKPTAQWTDTAEWAENVPRDLKFGQMSDERINFLSQFAQDEGIDIIVTGSRSETFGGLERRALDDDVVPFWRWGYPTGKNELDFFIRDGDLTDAHRAALKQHFGSDLTFDNWNRFKAYASEDPGGLVFTAGGQVYRNYRTPWQAPR